MMAEGMSLLIATFPLDSHPSLESYQAHQIFEGSGCFCNLEWSPTTCLCRCAKHRSMEGFEVGGNTCKKAWKMWGGLLTVTGWH